MIQPFDKIGRRNRLQPTSTGKRVSPTARDLLWFAKLAEHGPLPSSFLLAFSKDSHKSEKRAKERLTDLFNEDNTPHGGPYLVRPPQQFRTIDSRYNQLVYDLAPAAHKALADQDGIEATKPARSGPWLHSFMVSCIAASIELACLERDDLSYIPQSRILARAGAELRYPARTADPATGFEFKKDLIPDAVFGLEYRTGDGRRFRFFVVEADRATEPATSNNFNRKSFDRHLRQYREYLECGLYKEHMNLTAPMLVLNVTSDPKRMASMAKLTTEHFPAGCNYQLFHCWEDFGPVFRVPIPNRSLLDCLG
ncbi:replication-relaxation family protein [Parasphingorhabdus sp.]|uniref:replication-relaxation family protein n=1 Tax=Parasphingorhabdus sp. TaxID=2709688 RepID=UPI0030021C96